MFRMKPVVASDWGSGKTGRRRILCHEAAVGRGHQATMMAPTNARPAALHIVSRILADTLASDRVVMRFH